MKAQGDVEILASRPDRIVLRTINVRNGPQMHRLRGKHDPFMSSANGAIDLRNRRFNRSERDDALRDKTLAVRGPLVNEPVVVSLHAGEFQIRVPQRAECLAGKTGESWIKDGAGHTVN